VPLRASATAVIVKASPSTSVSLARTVAAGTIVVVSSRPATRSFSATGASLTGVTSIAIVAVARVSPSSTVTVTVSMPAKSSSGVYVNDGPSPTTVPWGEVP
jgi:hypothetical protein